MSRHQSRKHFFKNNPHAQAWARLDLATNQQNKTAPGPIKLKKDQFKGKRAVIIGSGIAGLTTAYELLSQQSGMEVIIYEAHNRTGGRCLTLRTGDTLTEDENSDLFNAKPGKTQVVRFQRPLGDSEPYLNAGPGRIPSSHKRLLGYLKTFGVDIQVYVMNSESNLVQMKGGPFASMPLAYRRLNHNTRGWLSQMVYQNAEELIRRSDANIPEEDMPDRVEQLQSLMINFGNLNAQGEYVVRTAPRGQDDGASDRAGYTVLPGVDQGEVAEAISLNEILASEYWEKTRFTQPQDFLWQPTLFQPVGGMDRVQHAFAQQVAALGGTIHLNSPVSSIDWDEKKEKFIVSVSKIGTDQCELVEADYCFSNAAIPFLKEIVTDSLQGSGGGFSKDFKDALNAVYKAQFRKNDTTYAAKFLACTTKVGWQADRSLWQGSHVTTKFHDHINCEVTTVPDSEIGVVPIFGGISWTDNPIVQIWYPSNDYQDQKGTLTGCYNFSENAFNMGKLPVEKRLELAREGATLFGKKFGEGLEHGVAIAWQNMPYIKGGWAQWHTVGKDTEESVKFFNILSQGTGIDDHEEAQASPKFFIVGDQLSSLPGWQEGAIASALHALNRLSHPELQTPYLASLPDTRIIVEGV